MNRFCFSFTLLLTLFLPQGVSAQCTDVEIVTISGNYSEEMSWEIWNSDNEMIYSFEPDGNYMTHTDNLCLEDGCYIFLAYDTYGDGWNGGVAEMSYLGENIQFELQDGGFGDYAFGINETDCLSYMEQLLASQIIIQYIDSGDKNNRINWAIQNRGMENPNNEFQNPEEFFAMFEDSLLVVFDPDHPLTQEPYANYRNFFNLYGWYWPDAPSVDNGWDWATFKGMRDAYFLPWADEEHGWATLFSTTKTGGGGGAGVQPETRTGDGRMFGMGWETLLHEFGHTMPQVPDEYTASGIWSGGNCWEGANTTGETFRDNIPWRNWIDEDTPLPTPYTEEYLDKIGAFEGALTNYFGCHRPTARGCYMGAGGFGPGYGLELCAPCRQRVVCNLYRYVDVIENPIPADTELSISGVETITFSADFVKPEPNTQVYSWYLNGELIAQGVEELEVEFGLCDSYELTLTVDDTTHWVRYDEKFANIYRKPFETRTWTIDQTGTGQNDIVADVVIQNADCSGEENGQVSFSIDGGVAPYQAWYEGLSVGLEHNNLAPGTYEYWITDANGCGIQATAMIESSQRLEVDICSEFDQTWSVSLDVNGYDINELSILWSDGSTGPILENVTDGDYSVAVTTADFCTVETEFALESMGSIEPLTTTQTTFNSAAGQANGAIYVEVAGGQPDYSIKWYDRYVKDLTIGDPILSDASGTDFGHLPEMAFDNDLGTKWAQFASNNIWLSFYFPEARVISAYTLTSGDDVEARDPSSWQLQASTNGTSWVDLDIRIDEDFPDRLLKKGYSFNNIVPYNYYRLFILENSGDQMTQLQEMELIGTDLSEAFTYRPEFDNQWSRVGLESGDYRYEVKDNQSQCAVEELNLLSGDEFTAADLIVIQESECAVAIENPSGGYNYLWFADEEGLIYLAEGTSFSPPYGGNFWVAAVSDNNNVQSNNLQGFAVTMPVQPELMDDGEGLLSVVDSDPNLEYRWYTQACGDTPVHIGNTYSPGAQNETFYVSSWWATEFPDPIDPQEIPSFMLKIDAADLDGDNEIDNPSPATSSLYPWAFVPDGGWEGGSWFAYRGNHQNGLGVADFATMWLQCFSPAISGYKTVIMAYQENSLSWKGSAPFYGLDDRMPYSADPENALYSDQVPQTTLNGDTWLNGELVDPMVTPNPLEFCVLGQTFSAGAGWTDCSDTHWEGKLGELLFFQDELNAAQMEGLSEYLRKKWISTADLESIRTPIDYMGASNTKTVQSSLHIYPNPATDHLYIKLQNWSSSSPLEIRIFDALGRVVKSANSAFSELIEIEVNELPVGWYQIELLQNEVRRVGRFIIQ